MIDISRRATLSQPICHNHITMHENAENGHETGDRDRYAKSGRCVGRTETGERCKWPAAPLSDKCQQHGGREDIRAALDTDAAADTDRAGAD